MIPDDIFDDDVSNIFEDEEIRDLAWLIYKMNYKSAEEVGEKISTVDEKVDSTISTWGRLMENEDFRELEEDTRTIIWELVKIRENDSPKNQTMVAEQYDISDARISQLKKKIDKLDL